MGTSGGVPPGPLLPLLALLLTLVSAAAAAEPAAPRALDALLEVPEVRAPGWEILAREALPLLCGDLPLPATCAGAGSVRAAQLPRLLTLDLLALPGLSSPPGHPELLLAVTALRALALPGGLEALPGLLRALPPSLDRDRLLLIAAPLEALLAPSLAPEERLAALRAALPKLTEPEALRLAAALAPPPAPLTPAAAAAHLRAQAALLGPLAAEALPGRPAPPLAALEVLATLAEGASWEEALPALLAAAPLPAPAPVRLAAQVALARDPAEAARALRVALLGPWSEPLIFDLNANLPAFDRETLDYSVFGELLLGYQLPQGGALARGVLTAYDLSDDATAEDVTASEAELDLWYSSAPARWRWEARAQLRAASYDTSLVSVRPGQDLFQESTALALRGSALGGLRYEQEWLGVALWLGVGGQQEGFSATTVTPNARVLTQERDAQGLLLTARLRGQAPLLAQVLVIRWSLDLLQHHLTQAELRPLATEPTLTSNTQREARARLFVDLDGLAVWGFTPSLNLGVDAVQRGEEGATVPSFGLGVRRVAF